MKNNRTYPYDKKILKKNLSIIDDLIKIDDQNVKKM